MARTPLSQGKIIILSSEWVPIQLMPFPLRAGIRGERKWHSQIIIMTMVKVRWSSQVRIRADVLLSNHNMQFFFYSCACGTGSSIPTNARVCDTPPFTMSNNGPYPKKSDIYRRPEQLEKDPAVLKMRTKTKEDAGTPWDWRGYQKSDVRTWCARAKFEWVPWAIWIANAVFSRVAGQK